MNNINYKDVNLIFSQIRCKDKVFILNKAFLFG